MKTLITTIVCFTLFICKTHAQKIGSTKTESYQADFEKKQSINLVANYTDTIVIPIQVLQIGINEDVYAMYPELKDKRVGLGVANIVLEYLESTNRFIFTEDKNEIKELVSSLKESIDKRELTILESKIETINTKFQSITQNLYNDTNQEPTNESYDTNDVSDVEFEEVK